MAGLIGASCVAMAAWAAGCAAAPRTALPRSVRFATGSVLLSLLVFALLALHAGYLAVYIVLFIGLAASAWKLHANGAPRMPRMPWFAVAGFAIVGAIYVVIALAPEVEPDAVAYHMRLTRDYVNLHRFTSRIEFFDVMPQGVEMLFTPAVAIGGYAAARLLHLTFLLMTIPLIRQIGRQLELPDYAGMVAAALFFLSPVVAIDSTCAYVDAGLVCACAAAFYLLLRWDKERSTGLLVCAALNAGFCYSIKQTFGLAAAAGFIFVAVRARRAIPLLAFTAVAAVPIAPWMLRAWLIAGSPVAPFFTRWLPNKACAPVIEQILTQFFSVMNPQFSWKRALPEYAVLGGHSGLMGAAFLLLPLALLALRKRAGRWLLSAAFVLALPALANAGTRFLMPAMLLAALAMAMALPARAGAALVLVQLLFAVPKEMDRLQKGGDWRLREIPWRAAFGLEPEQNYLARKLGEWPTGRMVEQNTPPGAHLLSFSGVPDAYVARDSTTYWHSLLTEQLRESLEFTLLGLQQRPGLYSAQIPLQNAQSLRASSPWEIRLLDANIGHVPVGARSWLPKAPGAVLEYTLPPRTQSTDFLIWPGDAPVTIQVKAQGGNWVPVPVTQHPVAADLRHDMASYIRRCGYGYVLTSAEGAFGPIGKSMLAEPEKWGVRHVAATGSDHLFEILN